MTIEDLLNETDHEVWVKIITKKKSIEVWTADFHGGYDPVLKEIKPFLSKEIGGDGIFIDMFKNPEGSGKVPMLCAIID